MRVEAARRNPHWTEIPDDLVPRRPHYLVSASTDRAYSIFRGATFVGSKIEFAADRPLCFYISAGDVVVLEEVGVWSQMFGQQLQPPPKRHRKARR